MPIKNIPVSALQAKGLRPDKTPPSPLVLVVDDQPNIADTMAAILRREGYAVIAEYDGESALKTAIVAPPQVVVTDISMPGMNGVELAIQLKALIPECGVVLFSAMLIPGEVLPPEAVAGNHFTFLAKPVAPETILNEVRKLTYQEGLTVQSGTVMQTARIQ